jgi:sulfite exporter TauE/SafE
MSHYLILFLAGLAGSMHCVGMCGGFACALGGDSRGRAATLWRHLIYNLGRVSSYCFLGACVGYLGLLLVGQGGETSWASLVQRGLAVLSGLLMLYIGLQFLGLLGRAGPSLPGIGWLADGLRGLTKSPAPGAPLALGALNGLLPCPLVYAFVAHAAGSGGPLPGLLIMAAFGLGTFPAMLVMGGVGFWARTRGVRSHRGPARVAWLTQVGGSPMFDTGLRQQAVRIAGAFIVLLGLITFARGVLPMSAHLHGMSLGL